MPVTRPAVQIFNRHEINETGMDGMDDGIRITPDAAAPEPVFAGRRGVWKLPDKTDAGVVGIEETRGNPPIAPPVEGGCFLKVTFDLRMKV